MISNLIAGISLGSIYAIIALGYTMVYGIAKMLNFAHGDVIMIGGYMCFCATVYLGWPPLMGVLLSVARGTSTVTEGVWDNRFRYVDELRKMGANIQVDGQVAVIEGVEKLLPAPLRASDLRAGAAMVVAALMANGTSEIEEIGHIERGYEDIVEKLRGRGAEIRKVERRPAALEQAL